MNKNMREFPVTVYGNMTRYNDVLSKSRVRIFYKYENRNGTYITDEFAEILLKSLPYAPVKGIYDGIDYGAHGECVEGRIYGIVPAEPNVAWETHLDEDGVERTYACADVLLFTALYPEASEITGKSQSMELFEPSLQYHQAIIHGSKYIVFDNGCFLGLQVLGDTVEPCFEGAAFYELQTSIEQVIEKIESISKNYTMDGGHSEMPNINFKLSDDQKFSALWSLLNTEYTEEGNWTISYSIQDVFDDYALAYNYETRSYERIYYTKNDENDSVEITKQETVYIVDVTEAEKTTLDTLRVLNGNTYELVDENLTNAATNFEELTAANTKILEMTESISTLTTEVENFTASTNEMTETINSLTDELNTLKEYQLNIQNQQKDAIFAEYEASLSEEIIAPYKENRDQYSVEDLDKELAYALKKSNPSVFNMKPEEGFVPIETPKTGIEAILDKYKK